MDLIGAFQKFTSEIFIAWTFLTLIYSNLGLMSDFTLLHRKYLLSSQSSSLYGALYKTSEMVGLVETCFNSMIN